jgi:putative membrane protein
VNNPTPESNAREPLTPGRFAAVNARVSTAAIGVLIWLIYIHEGPEAGGSARTLPAMNAVFNSISAVLLVFGLRAIRAGRRRLHQQLMLAALTSSALFLLNYVYYHYAQGDTHFAGEGAIRSFYLCVLASHIVLSIVVFPMILTAVYLALSERIATHRRVARWTFAGWMYVSVTGVMIFFMLHVIPFG